MRVALTPAGSPEPCAGLQSGFSGGSYTNVVTFGGDWIFLSSKQKFQLFKHRFLRKFINTFLVDFFNLSNFDMKEIFWEINISGVIGRVHFSSQNFFKSKKFSLIFFFRLEIFWNVLKNGSKIASKTHIFQIKLFNYH